MDKNTLNTVGEWAQGRVASGEEPPWTYHKLKLFAEIAKDLANGMDVVATHVENVEAKRANDDGTPAKVIQMEDFRPTQRNEELVLPS